MTLLSYFRKPTSAERVCVWLRTRAQNAARLYMQCVQPGHTCKAVAGCKICCKSVVRGPLLRLREFSKSESESEFAGRRLSKCCRQAFEFHDTFRNTQLQHSLHVQMLCDKQHARGE